MPPTTTRPSPIRKPALTIAVALYILFAIFTEDLVEFTIRYWLTFVVGYLLLRLVGVMFSPGITTQPGLLANPRLAPVYRQAAQIAMIDHLGYHIHKVVTPDIGETDNHDLFPHERAGTIVWDDPGATWDGYLVAMSAPMASPVDPAGISHYETAHPDDKVNYDQVKDIVSDLFERSGSTDEEFQVLLSDAEKRIADNYRKIEPVIEKIAMELTEPKTTLHEEQVETIINRAWESVPATLKK